MVSEVVDFVVVVTVAMVTDEMETFESLLLASALNFIFPAF